MSKNITFLELKYGNIYGGYPNFYAIAEAALLVYEVETNRIFIESFTNNVDVEVVSVYSKTNELGHTIGKGKEVINLNTRRRRIYKEDFRLDERGLAQAFNEVKRSRMGIKKFFGNNLHKYDVRQIIVFDGRRDVFLLEKCQVDFGRITFKDFQKELNQATEYLFSLNKLGKVINFDIDSHLRSNNLEYWLHPIAARQVTPKSAAYDAARLMMIYNEFKLHNTDFLLNAQRLLLKIQQMEEANKIAEANKALEASKAEKEKPKDSENDSTE